MALDKRYHETFPAKDAHGRDITIGAGIEDGAVIVATPGWFRMEDNDAERFAFRVMALAAVVRQQRGRS